MDYWRNLVSTPKLDPGQYLSFRSSKQKWSFLDKINWKSLKAWRWRKILKCLGCWGERFVKQPFPFTIFQLFTAGHKIRSTEKLKLRHNQCNTNIFDYSNIQILGGEYFVFEYEYLFSSIQIYLIFGIRIRSKSKLWIYSYLYSVRNLIFVSHCPKTSEKVHILHFLSTTV